MKHFLTLSILLGLLLISFGCKTNPTAPIFSPLPDPGNQPNVTSVSTIPPNLPYILGGVHSIAINGTGLETDSSKIQVFLGNTLVTNCTYTPTKITFLAPNIIKDSIIVRVLVAGAIKFSNAMYVSIRSVSPLITAIDTNKQVANAITFDRNGNLYVSVVTSAGVSDGIYKIAAGGGASQYAIKGTEAYFSGLKCRGDSVYAARRANRLVSRNSSTGAMTIFTASFPTAAFPTNIEDMDYDQDKLLWAGGNTNNGGLISVDSLKNVKQYTFPFGGIIHSVRVYSGSVYCSVEAGDGTKGVYKIPINADKTLGTATKYFDLSATVGNTYNVAYGITFDTQGNMYVGTDAPAGIYVVAPDQSVTSLYNGIMGPNCKYFAWAKNDPYLYVVRANAPPLNTKATSLLKIDMLGKLGAPYYGQ